MKILEAILVLCLYLINEEDSLLRCLFVYHVSRCLYGGFFQLVKLLGVLLLQLLTFKHRKFPGRELPRNMDRLPLQTLQRSRLRQRLRLLSHHLSRQALRWRTVRPVHFIVHNLPLRYTLVVVFGVAQ